MRSNRPIRPIRPIRPGIPAALAAAAMLLLGSNAVAGGGVSAADDASKPFLVKISADWCGTCARMKPTVEALEQNDALGARVVVLDVTDKQALATSRAEAERLGLGAFFAEYKSSTGVVGVLRGDNREVVTILRGETDLAVYESAVARARG